MLDLDLHCIQQLIKKMSIPGGKAPKHSVAVTSNITIIIWEYQIFKRSGEENPENWSDNISYITIIWFTLIIHICDIRGTEMSHLQFGSSINKL